MKTIKKDKNNQIFKYLHITGIALLGFVIFDRYVKVFLGRIGLIRFFGRLLYPDAEYFSYSIGIWGIAILPLTIIHFSLTKYYRKKYKDPILNKTFVIDIITLVLQILMLISALRNNYILWW